MTVAPLGLLWLWAAVLLPGMLCSAQMVKADIEERLRVTIYNSGSARLGSELLVDGAPVEDSQNLEAGKSLVFWIASASLVNMTYDTQSVILTVEKDTRGFLVVLDTYIHVADDSLWKNANRDMDKGYLRYIFLPGTDRLRKVTFINTDCYHCIPNIFGFDSEGYRGYHELSSRTSWAFNVSAGNWTKSVEVRPVQYEVKTILVSVRGLQTVVDRPGESEFLSFFVIVGGVIAAFVVLYWGHRLYLKMTEKPEDYKSMDEVTPSSTRIRSLDISPFRDTPPVPLAAPRLEIRLPRHHYAFVIHKDWNGINIGDYAFPWFVFISGSSLVLSISAQRKRSTDNRLLMRTIILKAIRRAVILFHLGFFFINGNHEMKHARVTGVLQYFAFTGLYNTLILALVPFWDRARKRLAWKWSQDTDQFALESPWHSHVIEWAFMILPAVVHIFVTQFLHVPDCPTGYRGVGGWQDYGLHKGCSGGAHGYIDFLTRAHIYQQTKYGDTRLIDPEGVMGGLNASFLCSLGAIMYQLLVSQSDLKWKSLVLGVFGSVLSLIGGGLTGFRAYGGFIPVNKLLWSLSYILVVGGTGCLSFLVLFLLVDVKKWYGGYPFLSMGMNPILIYLGHEILAGYLPFSWDIERVTHWSLFFCTSVGYSLWILIGIYCHHIGFFVKV